MQAGAATPSATVDVSTDHTRRAPRIAANYMPYKMQRDLEARGRSFVPRLNVRPLPGCMTRRWFRTPRARTSGARAQPAVQHRAGTSALCQAMRLSRLEHVEYQLACISSGRSKQQAVALGASAPVRPSYACERPPYSQTWLMWSRLG